MYTFLVILWIQWLVTDGSWQHATGVCGPAAGGGDSGGPYNLLIAVVTCSVSRVLLRSHSVHAHNILNVSKL